LPDVQQAGPIFITGWTDRNAGLNASIPISCIICAVEIGLKRPGDLRDFSGGVIAAAVLIASVLRLQSEKKDVNRSTLWST
jgi:hypothetical protein